MVYHVTLYTYTLSLYSIESAESMEYVDICRHDTNLNDVHHGMSPHIPMLYHGYSHPHLTIKSIQHQSAFLQHTTQYNVYHKVRTMVSLSLSFLLLCQGFTTLVLVNTFTYTHTQVPHTHTTTTKLAYTLPDSKWDSLQVPETLEPKWYILNCMATAEFTVLKNLEDHCTGATPDIIKFSVPTETKGTSRLKKAFTEEKPLFQGYVFVLCKLTRESYDTIAQVPSVRGWMGVPRKVRYKQLLPIPCPVS